jgi:hypothetical protein
MDSACRRFPTAMSASSRRGRGPANGLVAIREIGVDDDDAVSGDQVGGNGDCATPAAVLRRHDDSGRPILARERLGQRRRTHPGSIVDHDNGRHRGTSPSADGVCMTLAASPKRGDERHRRPERQGSSGLTAPRLRARKRG